MRRDARTRARRARRARGGGDDASRWRGRAARAARARWWTLDVDAFETRVTRSREPWVVSFTGSSEKCAICGEVSREFEKAARGGGGEIEGEFREPGRDEGGGRSRAVGEADAVDDDSRGERVPDVRDVESVRRAAVGENAGELSDFARRRSGWGRAGEGVRGVSRKTRCRRTW